MTGSGVRLVDVVLDDNVAPWRAEVGGVVGEGKLMPTTLAVMVGPVVGEVADAPVVGTCAEVELKDADVVLEP